MSMHMLEWQQHFVETIKEGNAVFFVGAGVSFDPPSMLPPWTYVAEGAVKCICPEELRNKEEEVISYSKNLRPEVLLDLMHEVIGDKAIEVLDVFKIKKFNLNHAFLASAILDYNISVITTNQDELIELATKQLYGKKPCVYYDKNGFRKWLNLEEKSAALFKLHGTLKEKQTIKAALKQVAMGLPQEAIDLLEYFSKRRCHIIFWGYSLTDDFDIVPALDHISGFERLVWLKHKEPCFEVVNEEQKKKVEEELRRDEEELQRCVDELRKGGLRPSERNDIQKEKYERQKKVNYERLLLNSKNFKVVEGYQPQVVIWRELLREAEDKRRREFFNQWSAAIDEWDKSLIIAEIFFYLRELVEGEGVANRKVVDWCNRCINILREQKLESRYPEKLVHAYSRKAWAHRFFKENKQALEDFKQAEDFLNLLLEKPLSPKESKKLLGKKGLILHQKGVVFQRLKNYPVALQCLEEALEIRMKLKDPDIAYTKFQIFLLKEEVGEYKEGYPQNDVESLKETLDNVQEELYERGDVKGANVMRHNIAYISQRLGIKAAEFKRFEEAQKQLKNATELYVRTIKERLKIFDTGGIAMAELRLSQCYYEFAKISLDLGDQHEASQKLEMAERYSERADKAYERIGDKFRQKQVKELKEKINELKSHISDDFGVL